jgi:hypothetical protein
MTVSMTDSKRYRLDTIQDGFVVKTGVDFQGNALTNIN